MCKGWMLASARGWKVDPMAKLLMSFPGVSDESPRLSPNDHLRMLIELLRPLGTELGRRWLAALLAVPEAERAALVAEVERRVAELGCPMADGATAAGDGEAAGGREFRVISSPAQRNGFTEHTETTYEVKPVAAEPRQRRRGRA